MILPQNGYPMQPVTSFTDDEKFQGVVATIPFVGLLISIATLSLFSPQWWHQRYSLVVFGWTIALGIILAVRDGPAPMLALLMQSLLDRYLSLVLLLLALYTVAGGIHVQGNFVGTPNFNLGLLFIGTALASVLGTTGAVVLLIRPLIQANFRRQYSTHVFVFFIFLVGNIGGGLTPLGDPPLFVGFTHGVTFEWTSSAMAPVVAVAATYLLVLFTIIDRQHWRNESIQKEVTRIKAQGRRNFVFVPVIIGTVLFSGICCREKQTQVSAGPFLQLRIEAILRNATLLCIAAVSYWITPSHIRQANQFTWAPMKEVAVLFAGIFITVVPVTEALQAIVGDNRPQNAISYFWLCGAFSSVLDNAPTYLIFFDLAGGSAQALMHDGSKILLAISSGAVFMGALTYIGNAPNLLVKSICEENNLRMPGFSSYLLWSGAILLPLFGIISAAFFL